jgi:4'-phosphopantetheinyl transferase
LTHGATLVAMRMPPPGASEIHVWSASLLLASERVEALRDELADDEKARAERMHTYDLGRRFIVARALLRYLLVAYLPVGAPAPLFRYGDRGKPELADEAGLAFNVSHAEDTALYAFASGRNVGIDIEATGRDVEIDGIARKVFSPLECEALDALSPSARRDAFFRIWTRKEAYIKALGAGFGYPTTSFTVSHCDDGDALIADDGDPHAPRRWRVIALDARPGYAAALAAPGRDWSVRQFDVPAVL